MSARVLVVDDIPQNVKLLEAKLTNEYYEVASAFNGVQCLQKLKGFAPDIVLLDVMMPEMDGFETCKRMKADPETSHIPVVMLTALSEVADRIKGLESGADDFITKPINDIHLFARVKSLVRLKLITDELRLRDQTSTQLGIIETAHSALAQQHTAKILVVNDDVVESKLIKDKLTSIGNQVAISEPLKTIDNAAKDNYDLIIVSTQLVEADGLRLCSQIRNNEKTRNIPLLILVDGDDKNLLVKGFEMGINDYLITPLDQNELVARVKTQVRRRKYQEALRSNYQQSISLAVVDSLTKLYNRRYLDAHLKNIVEQATNKGKELSLMTIDIDHFKQINDAPGFGHHIGDEVLKQVAERITNSIRSTDLATRPGGEEFVVVMPGTDIKAGQEIAERVRFAMNSIPFKISAGNGQVKSSVSVGITSLKAGDSSEELLKRSDEALYKAKNEGRNKVVIL